MRRRRRRLRVKLSRQGIVDDMGDNFEMVVDVEATSDEAQGLGRMITDWLIIEGIIDSSATDDVPGAGCYRAGPRHQLTAVLPETEEAVDFAQSALGRLEVATGRTVFSLARRQLGPAVCPLCKYSVVLTDPETGGETVDGELFADAFADWQRGGPGIVVCPSNGSAIAIDKWHWQGNWSIATGRVGFVFWNWPSLHPGFIDQISDRLGHCVVVTRGRA